MSEELKLETFAATPDDLARLSSLQTNPRRNNGRRNPNGVRSTVIPLPAHRKGERFVKGPIPLDWLTAATVCGYRADGVAIALWYSAGYQRANPVTLYPNILKAWRIHPRTAKRVLEQMADIGLVKAEFHRGRAPVVTILDLPEPAEST